MSLVTRLVFICGAIIVGAQIGDVPSLLEALDEYVALPPAGSFTLFVVARTLSFITGGRGCLPVCRWCISGSCPEGAGTTPSPLYSTYFQTLVFAKLENGKVSTTSAWLQISHNNTACMHETNSPCNVHHYLPCVLFNLDVWNSSNKFFQVHIAGLHVDVVIDGLREFLNWLFLLVA
jgi:hypothetical protein